MIDETNISQGLKERPYFLTQQASEKQVLAAYRDIVEAYIVPFLGADYAEESEGYDEGLYSRAVLSLVYARLLYNDIGKVAFATARPLRGETAAVAENEGNKIVRTYRRMGVTALQQLRTAAGLRGLGRYVPILGEEL